MRILGLDWGTVRVGAAMSDEEQKMAFPLEYTLDAKIAIQEIKKLTQEYEIEKIVMGLPVTLQNKENESTAQTKKFAEKLKQATQLPIEFVDERFSSVASTTALQEQKIKTIDQRHIKDNIAASLLLQQYLDRNKN